MKRLIILPALLLTLTAGQCGGDGADHVSSVGERVVYQTVDKPVREPCPVKEPTPPAKLARPLPDDPAALVALLLAKLLEYDGPGKYVSQVHDGFAICTRAVPPNAPQSPAAAH
jgi:hypothetical protein